MIRVYHVKDFSFRAPINPATDYTLVAGVRTDNLEEAWRLTNALDAPWTENVEIIAAPGGRHRSSVVGDLFEHKGERYVVAPVGFLPLAKVLDASGMITFKTLYVDPS